jgi:hypothetical protein
VLVAEVPGISKSDLDIQVKGRTVRLSGVKSVKYAEKASLHRRERLAGRFDRSVTLPIEIDPDGVTAECQDGILALSLPRAERDKPRSIKLRRRRGLIDPGAVSWRRSKHRCDSRPSDGAPWDRQSTLAATVSLIAARAVCAYILILAYLRQRIITAEERE